MGWVFDIFVDLMIDTEYSIFFLGSKQMFLASSEHFREFCFVISLSDFLLHQRT